MRAAYFRELRPYSEDEISAELESNSDESRAVIESLMNCGIVRYRTDDERSEEERIDSEGAAEKQRYQFRYVGIAIVGGHAIVCYPKYILNSNRPVREMRQALEVIRKLGQDDRLSTIWDSGTQNNLLVLLLRLLWFYDEYGIYSNYEETRILNGTGCIDWTRTIDMQNPFISNGIPIYVDYWARKMRRDEHDLITRVHRAIISDCSRFLEESGITNLISIGLIKLTNETVTDIGELGYLQYVIERERSGQYITWKQNVLDLMQRYLRKQSADTEKDTVLRLGTTSYYHAWEIACKTAFGDLLSYRLLDLNIALKDNWIDYGNRTLLQIIPRPIWRRPRGMGNAGDVDTLIPDTVTFTKYNNRELFCIYDAKYYVPTRFGQLVHQPGVESVTKQFLYQSAFQRFIEEHDFDMVVNAFIVPSEDGEVRKIASVSFPDVMSSTTAASVKFSNHIDMLALPAYEVFECYLRGRELNCSLYESLLERLLNNTCCY